MSERDQVLTTVTVCLMGNRQFRFGFRKEETALELFDFLKRYAKGEVTDTLYMNDDFGSVMFITSSTMIEAVLVTRVADELELAGELTLAQARAQQRLQQRAQKDAVLNRAGPNLVVPQGGLKFPQ